MGDRPDKPKAANVDGSVDVEQLFSGETPDEVVAEVRGYLKAVKRIVEQDPRQPSAEESQAFAGMRVLVGIAREIAKGSEGNALIVDNVDVLKTKYVDKFAGTALSPSGAASSDTATRLQPSPVIPQTQSAAPPRPTLEAAGRWSRPAGAGRQRRVDVGHDRQLVAAAGPVQRLQGGVHNLTKSRAVEWAASGVRVNAVAPTYINTPLIARVVEAAHGANGMVDQWLQLTPMGRLGEPAEIASVVQFLASDAASLMTGSIVAVDGGYTSI